MDKKTIEKLLTRIDTDLQSLVDNLRGDSQRTLDPVLKTTALISIEHMEVDRKCIEQIKDLLKQD